MRFVHAGPKVEQEEEYIANRLLKRLDSLKREKQVCVQLTKNVSVFVDVCIGELCTAYLSFLCPEMLQASAVRQVLATEVEQEEEYLVNNLQKRMGKLNLEKTELEKELEKLHRKARTTIYELDCHIHERHSSYPKLDSLAVRFWMCV